MLTKAEALDELRSMFRSTLAASSAGGNHARLSRARGCVDGYMRALLDLGVASRAELLTLVAAERERAHGPGARTVEPGADEIVAA
ncbi:MAG TPA: hypothetical protein VE987_18205 [Polyangiaceae bacterium]|nr:hypothetical protein [Polyangiaceae bacterium]